MTSSKYPYKDDYTDKYYDELTDDEKQQWSIIQKKTAG